MSGLRRIAVPFVAAAPAGVRVRARLRVSSEDEAVLQAAGAHLGSLAGSAGGTGGRALLRKRGHLTEAGLTEARWRQEWESARLFLTADGERDKLWGTGLYPARSLGTVMSPPWQAARTP